MARISLRILWVGDVPNSDCICRIYPLKISLSLSEGKFVTSLRFQLDEFCVDFEAPIPALAKLYAMLLWLPIDASGRQVEAILAVCQKDRYPEHAEKGLDGKRKILQFSSYFWYRELRLKRFQERKGYS
jgi:hypothetical protein